jgi:serine/threonine-protein kinase RsbT
MPIERDEALPLLSSEDIVRVRQKVRATAVEIGFGLVDQTKIVTAASELARNTVQHGGGGGMQLQILRESTRRGLRVVFEDRGPGIPDVEQAMKDGYTTADGLGLGLGGAKRLSHEFQISSKLGEGTRVTITCWR